MKSLKKFLEKIVAEKPANNFHAGRVDLADTILCDYLNQTYGICDKCLHKILKMREAEIAKQEGYKPVQNAKCRVRHECERKICAMYDINETS